MWDVPDSNVCVRVRVCGGLVVKILTRDLLVVSSCPGCKFVSCLCWFSELSVSFGDGGQIPLSFPQIYFSNFAK